MTWIGRLSAAASSRPSAVRMTQEKSWPELNTPERAVRMQKYPEIEVLPVQYSGCDPAKSLNVATDFYTANPDLVGFFGACDGGGTGSGQLVKQKGLQGKVHVVSFDTSPEELQLFKDGHIDALIVQDPFQMGYRGVHARDKV
jgi:ribose transport system substrate-binding protein